MSLLRPFKKIFYKSNVRKVATKLGKENGNFARKVREVYKKIQRKNIGILLLKDQALLFIVIVDIMLLSSMQLLGAYVVEKVM